MQRWHLAQVNVGRLIAPEGDPRVAPFFEALDRINVLAEASPGFVWRLTGEGNNATDLQPTPDPLLIPNMSVWTDAEALFDFVYRSAHTPVMARRREFFERYEGVYQALWWIESGHRPSIDEAFARLWMIERYGPTEHAFTFKKRFPAPGLATPPVDHNPVRGVSARPESPRRPVPLLPTLLVAAAVAAMIGLGVWQLRRAEWKADLLARYGEAQAMSAAVPWPRDEQAMERSLFRWSGFDCQRVLSLRTTAAKSASGESGVAQVADCAIDGGGEAEVALGWSLPTQHVDWSGGRVEGIIAPGGEFGGTLHLARPPEGLEPLAPPDPADLPNNHLAYAGQWFFFALTAVAIYVLALRRRWHG